MNLWLGVGEGEDSKGVWDGHVHTAVFKMDNQQGPPATQGALLNVTWQPGWEGEFGGEWIHVCGWLNPSAFHLKLSQHC